MPPTALRSCLVRGVDKRRLKCDSGIFSKGQRDCEVFVYVSVKHLLWQWVEAVVDDVRGAEVLLKRLTRLQERVLLWVLLLLLLPQVGSQDLKNRLGWGSMKCWCA
jgi:hypothetical protein